MNHRIRDHLVFSTRSQQNIKDFVKKKQISIPVAIMLYNPTNTNANENNHSIIKTDFVSCRD